MPPARPSGNCGKAAAGSARPGIIQAGQERPVQALSQRVPAGAGRPRPLPQRVNKDGVLYTLAYGNPCTVATSIPIEKKPLFHFLPGTQAFSLRHDRLRIPLPELPELEHFAARSRRS